MKKIIGLISYGTYSKHMNYGAHLHVYAFQQILKRYGVNSVIIDYRSRMLWRYSIKYPFLNCLNILNYKTFLKEQYNNILGFFDNLRKYHKVQTFMDNNLIKTKRRYSYKQLKNAKCLENICFTDFVCESDVIWKLGKRGYLDDCFFLNFPVAEKCRKIAYSPSLGSKAFSENDKVKYLSFIKNFEAISARERQGAEYLSTITGHHVDWVLDPTLLLDSSDYNRIAIEPDVSNYVLLYNCMVNDTEMIHAAEDFSHSQGLELIEISNFAVNKQRYNHRVLTDVGIEEWLGYFKKAKFVLCNAFHGLCFAVIYKRPLYVFQRDKSDYRMQNITDALGIEQCLIPCDDKRIPNLYPIINYDDVYKRLNLHRQRSFKFIEDNIVNL